MKTFLSISKKECLRIYPELIKNHERHTNIAKILAQNFEYGVARSHLILGTEELVKALILYLDGRGFEIRKIKGIKKLFYLHSPRHELSSIFVSISMVMQLTIKLFERVKELTNNPNLEMKRFEKIIFHSDEMFAETHMKRLESKIISRYVSQFNLHLCFWGAADIYKQRGFYIDYQNSLQKPSDITEELFLDAVEVTKTFSSFCIKCISELDSMDSATTQLVIKTMKENEKFQKAIEMFFSK